MAISRSARRAFHLLASLALGVGPAVAQPASQVAASPKAAPPAPPPLTSGRVVDDAGMSAPGAVGVAFSASVLDSNAAEFVTDRVGRFTMKDSPKAPFNLVVFPRELTARTPAPLLVKNRAAFDPAPLKMDKGVAVRARLVDPEGAPVMGSVRFLSVSGVELPDLLRLRETVARADPEGRVSFNAPVGAQVFIAEDPGHIGERFERRIAPVQPGKEGTGPVDLGTVVLKPGSTVRGSVVDDLGQPLVGVVLTTFNNQRSTQVETFMARSKEGGRFELLGLREGGVYVAMKLLGYHAENVVLHVGDQDVPLVMGRMGAVSGRVIDDRGEPVTGARVSFKGLGKLAGRGLGNGLFQMSEFTLDGLPPFLGLISISVPGFRQKLLEDVRVSSGETTMLGDIVLDRGRTVAGRVVDSKDAAVPEAKLLAWRSGTYEKMATTGNTRGEFSLGGLPSGNVEVEAQAPGYAPRQIRIEIAAGDDPKPVRIVLDKGGRILGSLRTRRGLPVNQAVVRVSPMPGAIDWSRTATTDESGAFEVKDLPSGAVLLSVLGAEEGRQSMKMFNPVVNREMDIVAGEVKRADVVLRELEIIGRVSGVPSVPDLRAVFSSPRGRGMGYGDGRPGGVIPTTSGAPRFSAPVDSAGAFRLVVDEPGRYGVQVESLNPPRTTVLRQTVDIPDLPPEVSEFAVELLVTSVRLAGVIVDKGTAEPVPGARLSAGTGVAGGAAISGANGRFEVYALPGPLEVTVTAEGFNRREIKMTLSEPAPDQKIELTRSAPTEETILKGTARLDSGAPAALAVVRALPVDRDTSMVLWVQTDAAGRFAWTDAIRGRYAIWASLGGELVGHATWESGGAAVDVVLKPAVAVTYALFDESGAELKDSWISVRSVDGLPFLGELRGGQGFVPPGRLVVRAETETHLGTTTVEARVGEPLRITVIATPKAK